MSQAPTHQARKRFGQNFLHDGNTIARIVAALDPQPQDHFVEIGPGKGAITRPLSEKSGRLDVIEIDRDLAAALQDSDWAAAIHVHQSDALKFDFSTVCDKTSPDEKDRSLRLAGNLPYNISTPLLFHLLDQQRLFKDIHVMLQREVVDRMTADPGSRTYGRLTVALAARCHVERLFIIKPGAFRPAPKVQSAFARLVPLDQPLIDDGLIPAFERVLRLAFGQRRKQLRNALREVLSVAQIQSAGIDPQARAETVSVQQFVSLAKLAEIE